MDAFTKGFLRKTKNTDKDSSLFLPSVFIRENIKITFLMGSVFTIGEMEKYTRESGVKVKNKDKANGLDQKEKIILANGKTVSLQARGFTFGTT